MEDGRGYSGIGSGKSIGLAEGILLPAEAVESNRSRPKSINFNADNISDQNQSVTALEKALTGVTRDIQSATVAIAKLEDKSNRAERHSRSFIVRLLGAREVDGENCVDTVQQILLDKFAITGNVIENAHRTGKRSADDKGTFAT